MRLKASLTGFLAAAGLMVAAPALGQSYNVQLNKTELVRLSEPASAVIIGNPDVADVSVHSSDTIFIVGRGFGDTNIIILNNEGRTVMNADVHVTSSSGRNNVRVFSGGSVKRSSYNCSPYCQPAPVLGDQLDFVSANTPKEQTINNTVASGTTSGSPSFVGMTTEDHNFPEFGQKAREREPVADAGRTDH